MSKTNDPHIGSFLAFACWVDERIRSAYEGLPEWLPLPLPNGVEDPEFAALMHEMHLSPAAYKEIPRYRK